MTPEQLAQLLDEIGKRLGPAGDYVFRIAVQRAVISGVLQTVLGAVLLGAGLFTGYRLARYATEPEQDSYSDRWFAAAIGGTGLFFVCLLGLGLLYFGVLTLLTPEYSALRDIVSAIGSAK